jgi:anti-sigma regulatory factor (Ser/Thr protein kinase)
VAVISFHDHIDYVVFQPRGDLSLRTLSQIRDAVVACLLKTGRALIDLSGLHCGQAELLSVFPTALVRAGGWPAARLVVFGADAGLRLMLDSASIADLVPVANDLPSARALLSQRPVRVEHERHLPPHHSAPATARLSLRQTCTAWSLPEAVVDTAELVVSELVTNAVVHAHSPSLLTLSQTGSTLRIAVRDYRLTPIPRPRPIDIAAPRGRGLHLVTAVTDTWAVDQHPDGKTVWALLAWTPITKQPRQ